MRCRSITGAFALTRATAVASAPLLTSSLPSARPSRRTAAIFPLRSAPAGLYTAYRCCSSLGTLSHAHAKAAATTSFTAEGLTPSTTPNISTTTEVPSAVMHRILSNKMELLRLLRCSSENTSAAVSRLEHALVKHLGLRDILQRLVDNGEMLAPDVATGGSCNAASVTAGAHTSRAAEIPEAWVAAMWSVLAPHCMFVYTNPAHALGTLTDQASSQKHRRSELHVMPFDWPTAVSAVAAQLPYEGLSEAELVASLCARHRVLERYSPVFAGRYTQSESLAAWMHHRFADQVVVTRSAVSGAPLYHTTGRNSISISWTPSPTSASTSVTQKPLISTLQKAAEDAGSPKTRAMLSALQHSLHLLGRGHQLPVWTYTSTLSALQPSTSPLASASPAVWKATWMAEPLLQRSFHLDAYMRVRARDVRCGGTHGPLLVLIDATSIDAAAVRAALAEREPRMSVGGGGGAAGATVKVLSRTSLSPEATHAFESAVQAYAQSPVLMEVVVLDALLDAQHVVGAVLESYAADPRVGTYAAAASDNTGRSEVLLLCGEMNRAPLEAVLVEEPQSSLDVTLVTSKISAGAQ